MIITIKQTSVLGVLVYKQSIYVYVCGPAIFHSVYAKMGCWFSIYYGLDW